MQAMDRINVCVMVGFEWVEEKAETKRDPLLKPGPLVVGMRVCVASRLLFL